MCRIHYTTIERLRNYINDARLFCPWIPHTIIFIHHYYIFTKRRITITKLVKQFVIFKPLSYCFEETIGFDLKVSFASRPVSHLIRWYDNEVIQQKNFEKKLFSSTGLFMDWKLQTKYAAFNGGVNFICFRLDISFLDKLGPKNRNCQFKLRFVTTTNSNMQNSMALFTFSVSDRKHSFWANLVQTIRLVSLSWNLVTGPIWICRIQWWCSIFLL